jgi:phage anti-repressor protein
VERRKAKAAMTDFDRYKAMVQKAGHARQVRKVFNKLKKSA